MGTRRGSYGHVNLSGGASSECLDPQLTVASPQLVEGTGGQCPGGSGATDCKGRTPMV